MGLIVRLLFHYALVTVSSCFLLAAGQESVSPQINEQDQIQYAFLVRNLNSDLPGVLFKYCWDASENPCACNVDSGSTPRRVVCDKEGFITRLELPNNKMLGNLDVDILRKFSRLEFVDMSSKSASSSATNRNILRIGDNHPCVNIPECWDGTWGCFFENSNLEVCPLTEAPTGTPTDAPILPVPTGSPTAGDPPILRKDLLAWRDFYDSLDGTQWTRCSGANARRNPCLDPECAQIPGDSRYVACSLAPRRRALATSESARELQSEFVYRITSISLPSNRMSGRLYGRDIDALEALRYVDLRGNAILGDGPGTGCVNIQICNDESLKDEVTCEVPGLCGPVLPVIAQGNGSEPGLWAPGFTYSDMNATVADSIAFRFPNDNSSDVFLLPDKDAFNSCDFFQCPIYRRRQ